MTGEELRTFRKSLGVTIEHFAAMSGYSWLGIQRMEKGRARVSKRVIAIVQLLEKQKTLQGELHGTVKLRPRT